MGKVIKLGPRQLLKGLKWGDFFAAKDGTIAVHDSVLKLRFGMFFHIPVCSIIQNDKKHIVLRKVSMKSWGKNTIHNFEGRGWAYLISRDEAIGAWWGVASSAEAAALLSSMPREGYLLARSKADLLRRS